MKLTCQILVCAWLFASAVCTRAGDFTSFYVFGDGVSSMTEGGGDYFYQGRNSNGRVWVELLAERQDLICDSNKNLSYYGHYSSDLVANIAGFVPPADSSNALYVIWVCDADFVANVRDLGTNIVQWTNSIKNSLSNHFQIITNIYYAKGARYLVMPNAVDLGEVPAYINSPPANKAFIRTQTINFNSQFAQLITNTAASLPGLTIYAPDVFSLLDNIVTNSAAYGLKKPSTYVMLDLPLAQRTLNGPGTNYVYWDDLNPTAMAHEILADLVVEMIFPSRLSASAVGSASNLLSVVNVPVGLNGSLEGSTNISGWSTVQTFISTNKTQTVVVPATGSQQYYRLKFPFSWTWP